MVAAEAAAAGVLPVCADHSGLHEVASALASSLPEGAAPLVRFELGPGAVESIADRLSRWLELPGPVRQEARSALAQTVKDLWSWEVVAGSVVAASAGRLDEISLVPDASSD
jgi:glycosyltransferase involved in cell wall biosynthesis